MCGGGRYDLLVEQLGGQPTPATGFAAGIERILLACENEKSLKLPKRKIDLFVACLDEELFGKVFEIAFHLRRKNISVECDYMNRSLKAQMREANRLNAKYVLFIGGDEYKKGTANLKSMESGKQELVQIDKLDEVLANQKSKVKSQKD